MNELNDNELKCVILDYACEVFGGMDLSKRKEGKYWIDGKIHDVGEIEKIQIDFKGCNVLIWMKEEK